MALNTDSTDYLTVRRLWSIMSSFKDKIVTALGKKSDKSSTVSNVAWSSSKLTKTINGTTTDVVSASTLKSAMSLNNVTNDAQVKRSEMGTANGVATLDANGIINTSQLPSYVDDVLEYSAKSQFPATGETGKIYVDTSTNLTWRWSGTTYVEISPSLALGETSSTAYRGDRGKTAYDHSQLTSGNPHNVTATDVKAVSYDTNAQGLTDTQKSNARTNIGAGTSNLALGTSSTTAAKGDHTHTTSIASDSSSGTVVTLAHNTQYKLTAGGTSVLFKTPTDSNTDTKVTQTKDDSGTTAYPLLMAGATDPNGSATTARYDSGVKLTPSTNTISANISGNATTATTATDYNTSSGTIKTALDGKLNVDGSNATQTGTSAIVKTLGNGSDNIWNGDRFPANGHNSQSTNPDDFTLRSTDHLLNFLFRKGTGGFNYADLDTSMKEFGHAYGATIDSDNGCYGWKIGETSHTGGYSSAAFKAIVVVWEWDAPNWDHTGYSGRNFVGVLDITHRITEATISDSVDKKIGTLTCICPMYCENSNGNRGYTVFVKQAAGTHKAEWYIGRNTASANMNSKIQYGRLSIFPIMEYRWKKFIVQQNSSISFNSDKDDYWGNRNVPFFSYDKYSGVGSNSLPLYAKSNGELSSVNASSTQGNFIRSLGAWSTVSEDNEAIPAANITSGGTTQGRYTFASIWNWITSHTQTHILKTSSDVYWGVGADSNHFIDLDYDSRTSSPKMGIWVRWGSGSNAKFMAECDASGNCTFNGTSERARYAYHVYYIGGGTANWIKIGRITSSANSGSSGGALTAIISSGYNSDNELSAQLIRVSIRSKGTSYNGVNIVGDNVTLGLRSAVNNGDARFAVHTVTDRTTSVNGVYDIYVEKKAWHHVDVLLLHNDDATMTFNADTTKAISDTTDMTIFSPTLPYAGNADTASLLAVANAAGTGVTSYYMRAIEHTTGGTTYIALTKNDGTSNVRVKSAENADGCDGWKFKVGSLGTATDTIYFIAGS